MHSNSTIFLLLLPESCLASCPPVQVCVETTKSNSIMPSFYFAKVAAAKGAIMLAELKCAKATGLDNIPARFLRDSAEQIAPCLTHIVNLSLEQGIFPRDMIHAKVIPLYKKGIKSDPGNYRPVSILSITSKTLERVVHRQIMNMSTNVL